MLDNQYPWYSYYYLTPEVLQNFHWDNSFYLLLIPLVPVLFFLRWVFYFPLRQKFDIAIPKDYNNQWNLVQLYRLIPISTQIIALCFVLLALARPQKVNEQLEQFDQGINIVLVLDLSESMLLEDLRPNRLEAAKEITRKFVSGRVNDRIGLVVFSGAVLTMVPLTTDYDVLQYYISECSVNTINVGGSSIGNAMAVGINRLNESSSGAKVLILISDGENTSGTLDPGLAAELAFGYGIKLYTVGIGKEGQVPYGRDSTGKRQTVKSNLDENLLRVIAEKTKGNYFRATNNNSLNEVFITINSLEKGIIKESRFRDTQDYYKIYLYWALSFFLLWMVMKNSFLNNFLED